jgi:phosphosulfolactate synthase (CoM biosynthesis protein A)
MVQLGQGLRQQLFDMVRDQGMNPVGEIGDKRESSSIMSIIDEVNEVLEMGAEFALIEAAELMHGGVPNEELILAIRQNVDITRCIFELATPRVGSTTVQIYAGKKFLVKDVWPRCEFGQRDTRCGDRN